MSQPPAHNFPGHRLDHGNALPPALPNYGHGNFYPPYAPDRLHFPQYPHQYLPAPHNFHHNIPHPAYVGNQPVPQMHPLQMGALPDLQQPPAHPLMQPAPLPPHPVYNGPLRDIQPPAAPARRAQLPKQRPNQETKPGVFIFQVDVIENGAKREFTAETDVAWQDFRRLTIGLLENNEVELAYKVTGDTGRASHLKTGTDFEAAMARVCQKALSARSRPVGLEIRNIAKAPPSKKVAPKRKRNDDIPGSPTQELNTQLRAYKQLSATLKCEAHSGHCFVDRTHGTDNHRRLTHAEMTLWAKKMSLGEASKFSPPHCLAFDRLPSKKPRHSASSSNSGIPEVHVTIQNITSEGGAASTQYPTAVTTHLAPPASEGSVLSSSQTKPNVSEAASAQPQAGMHIPHCESDSPDFPSDFIPPFFPQRPDVTTTPPNVPLALPMEGTVTPSACSPDPINPTTNDDDWSPKAPFTQIPRLSSPDLPLSKADSFWTAPLESTGIESNIFPTVQSIVDGLAEQRPEYDFGRLEENLSGAGITGSHQILTVPEDVLCVVAQLSLSAIRVLRNHTRRMILPRLGFINHYDDPEVSSDSDTTGHKDLNNNIDNDPLEDITDHDSEGNQSDRDHDDHGDIGKVNREGEDDNFTEWDI